MSAAADGAGDKLEGITLRLMHSGDPEDFERADDELMELVRAGDQRAHNVARVMLWRAASDGVLSEAEYRRGLAILARANVDLSSIPPLGFGRN